MNEHSLHRKTMQLLFVGKIHEKGEKQNNSEFLQNKATKEHRKIHHCKYESNKKSSDALKT